MCGEEKTINDDPKELAIRGLHNIILNLLKKNYEETNHKLLDLGAGEGALSLKLKKFGFDVYATDISAEIFKVKDIPFKIANLDKNIPYTDNFFDCIVCVELLEHLKNPWITMEEIRRVLKQNGLLVLTTPNIHNLSSKLRFFLFNKFYGFNATKITSPMEHIHPFTVTELKLMLNENGFKLLKILYDRPFMRYFYRLFPPNQLFGVTNILITKKL